MLEKVKNHLLKNKTIYISALAFVFFVNVAHASSGADLNFDTSSLIGAFDGIIKKMFEVLGQVVPKALQIVGVVLVYKFGVKLFHRFSNQG